MMTREERRLLHAALKLSREHARLNRLLLVTVNTLAKAVECFIDSVLTRERLTVSEELGGWRLVETYPKGVTLYGPRAWQTPGGTWARASGHAGRPEKRGAFRGTTNVLVSLEG